jgi:DNA helicase HerA-like ATPase
MTDPFHAGRSARVRELCQKLKPILGTQADRIWLAYLAENPEGKMQFEEYVELLANRYLVGSLDQENIVLLPPDQTAAAGKYPLGQVIYNNQPLYPFGLRENEWIQHVGVFGRSGAGKTNLGFLIVQRLQENHKPFLVFDWKRNYRDLLLLPGFDNLAVYTVGRDIAPLQFNPLIPPDLTDPKSWLKKLIAIIAHAYGLGNGVLYLLQEFIDQVYEQAGVYDGRIEKWPTLAEVYEVAKNYDARGRQAGWLASTLRALASLCFGQMDKLVNHGQDDLEELFRQPVVLELDALSQADKVFTTEILLAWLHARRMIDGKRESFSSAVIIEEAHHILSNERFSLVGGQSVMDITFREIREFGVAMIVLDQHPSQISLPALGNTYCTICFNLKHKTDVNAMAQAMLLKDDEKDSLGSLPVGQAIVKLQGRTSRPFLVQVPEFEILKGSVSDQQLLDHMTHLGLLTPEPCPTMPLKTSQKLNTSLSDDQAMLFLQDVKDYPESGIAQRYKRLALSVRQGQKLKSRLISENLISETLETTFHGTLRRIRLTEKGETILSDPAKHLSQA